MEKKTSRTRQTEELNYKYCPCCKSTLSFKSLENKIVLMCPKCQFTFWNNPRPVVSALIIFKRKILLIKRNAIVYKNYWSFPGGVIDYLETPVSALKREVFEETKLHVNKLAELIVKISKSRSNIIHKPMRPGEIEKTKLKANIATLKKLNFKYEYKLKEGLEETVRWYKNALH